MQLGNTKVCVACSPGPGDPERPGEVGDQRGKATSPKSHILDGWDWGLSPLPSGPFCLRAADGMRMGEVDAEPHGGSAVPGALSTSLSYPPDPCPWGGGRCWPAPPGRGKPSAQALCPWHLHLSWPGLKSFMALRIHRLASANPHRHSPGPLGGQAASCAQGSRLAWPYSASVARRSHFTSLCFNLLICQSKQGPDWEGCSGDGTCFSGPLAHAQASVAMSCRCGCITGGAPGGRAEGMGARLTLRVCQDPDAVLFPPSPAS